MGKIKKVRMGKEWHWNNWGGEANKEESRLINPVKSEATGVDKRGKSVRSDQGTNAAWKLGRILSEGVVIGSLGDASDLNEHLQSGWPGRERLYGIEKAGENFMVLRNQCPSWRVAGISWVCNPERSDFARMKKGGGRETVFSVFFAVWKGGLGEGKQRRKT